MDTTEAITARSGFPGSTFLVLGGTGGIGSEVCRRLAAHGANLFVAGRDRDRLRSLTNLVHAESMAVDSSVPGKIEECFQRAKERFGRVDGAVNCIGSLLLKPAHLTSDAEWQATLSVNLTSAFETVRAAARVMLDTGGSIVLVSSAAARVGLANHEAIAASKAGIVGLTLAAAASYASRRIRVNCVAPGLIRTPLTARLTASPAAVKATGAMHALGRIGEPADIAAAIEWLLDPRQTWITGQVIGVDGGLASLRPKELA
jgi:NAD(P)-dependent dehydrogenase (short-subunit alcohol dehydrogenase family)